MDYYTENAGKLSDQYDSLAPEVVNQSWKHHIENKKGLALDAYPGEG